MANGSLIKVELEKYNALHNRKAYGLETARKKWFTLPSDSKFIRKAIKILSSSDTILDVACGKGSFIDHFKETLNSEIQGIDISNIAVDSRPDLSIDLGSIHRLPYSDNSYDCVYHLDGMEHIPVTLQSKVLDEQFRVAKKFIIHSLSTNIDKRSDEYLKKININTTSVHINLKSFDEWKNFFRKKARENGWKIIEFDCVSFDTQVCIIMKNNTSK